MKIKFSTCLQQIMLYDLKRRLNTRSLQSDMKFYECWPFGNDSKLDVHTYQQLINIYVPEKPPVLVSLKANGIYYKHKIN